MNQTARPRTHPYSAAVPRGSDGVYASALRALSEAGVPFLVGGAFALRHFCPVERPTKDLDLFVLERDVGPALEALAGRGFATSVPFPHWLAKAKWGADFVDVIFNSGNGLTPVDDAWFRHAEPSSLLGCEVWVCPPEEMIWSKAYVMERERFDGADVAHLLRARAGRLDWGRLLRRFADHATVLLSHLLLFRFVYPDHSRAVPDRLLEELFARARREGRGCPDDDRLCRGTLLSREQYLQDVAAGYRDGRLPPTGRRSPEEIAVWTNEIQGRALTRA